MDALLSLLGDHGRGVLATIKRDGRPQLSVVAYAYDRDKRVIRVSVTDGRAKTRNLRRDPRASLQVTGSNVYSYVVAEGTADLSPIAADPYDATVDELVEVYRKVAGEHPDWDDYRAAMVADKRLVIRIPVEYAYGQAPSGG
jgi:PPOX class probable F420-dependent enzyme